MELDFVRVMIFVNHIWMEVENVELYNDVIYVVYISRACESKSL